nr:probable lysine-specific demethylase ELF6 isoform X2 [Cicer arietinum]
MFWKAASEKPIYVEYANDVPGSAFGEFQGQNYHSRNRQRKRTYYTSSVDRSVCKQTEMGGVKDTLNNKSYGVSTPSHDDTCFETSKSAMTMLTSTPNEVSQSSKEKSLDANTDMQGTAGWKLSNSPWNLQVIARASGSLTRFMPDDIPGVTSPMVYIGMLFSWFAWHVEDHELHSLNFLHTGSSKTWYAVPGDYAFDFEEVIRKEGYGGDIDQFDALKLLGEKTTLLSPEVVVESGIPCCRLVQNPGEFVVTFPRAYHVGFSHGFNCGEAANFGTPQWLGVAKEAAVRRATMNHLPMLSHQQLLYLLTMSFISRVPRTLLPGVRSSRLRDRQKEEREFQVKQAFIEDMLQENKLLSTLLGKEATEQVVLWNADLLPDSGKYRQLPDLASTSGTYTVDTSNDNISSADKSSHCLLDEMNLYMENLTDFDVGCDDLPCHFQTDSGALVCVGCGILGFPFMAVIQPTEKLIMELLHDNHRLVEDSSLNSVASLHGVVSRDLSVSELASAKDPLDQSLNKCNKCWNISSKLLKPRIFCLDHAVQVVEMLQSKGGANVLIICHSDYPKIKAHARAVAEEIQSAFDYNEVPMDIASPENLALIDLAIDGEEVDDCEDWTSKLGLNLRFCVNNINNSPSKQVPLALALGMQFYDKRPGLSLNWHSRRTRSKRSNRLAQTKPDSIQIKKDDQLQGRVDDSTDKKKLIQYSRRKFKSKQSCFSVASTVRESHEKSKNVSDVLSGNHEKCVSKDELDTDNFRGDCALSRSFASAAMSPLHHEIQNAEAPTIMSLNAASSQLSNSFPEHISVIEKVGAEIENKTIQDDIDGKMDSTFSHSKAHYNTNDDKAISEHIPNADVCEVPRELRAAADFHNTVSLDAKIQQERQVGKRGEKEIIQPTRISEKQMCEFTRGENAEVLQDEVILESAKQFQIQNENRTDEETVSNSVAKGDNGSVTTSELGCSEVSAETCPKEDSCIQFNSNTEEEMEIQPINKIDEELSVSYQECSQSEKVTCVGENANGSEVHLSQDNGELGSCELTTAVPKSNAGKKKKRKMMEDTAKNQFDCDDFIRSPCERLRPRTGKIATGKSGGHISQNDEENPVAKRTRRPPEASVPRKDKKVVVKRPHKCDLDGCRMSFTTKAELLMHKRNLCPHKGCGKKFSSHKYARIHQRVHEDDRPLKCSWKGCSMSFKWAWARTEHMRVHTGEKPYQCKVEGCGLSFRFVSDYSRHRRKTGHYVKSSA